jgi:hypothetical protein
MEEKINYRYVLFLCLITTLIIVGSFISVYIFLWAWGTYGILSLVFLAIVILCISAIFYLRESRKKGKTTVARE